MNAIDAATISAWGQVPGGALHVSGHAGMFSAVRALKERGGERPSALASGFVASRSTTRGPSGFGSAHPRSGRDAYAQNLVAPMATSKGVRAVDKGLWEAACSLRQFLGDMLTDEQAANVDAELAGLLERAGRGEDVEAPLRAVLERHRATSVFLDMVLDDAPDFRPPEVVSETTRGFQGLPGQSQPIPPVGKFCCPHGDYVWYRLAVGARPPSCPTHQCSLELMQSG
jgi:hypothetical protein